MSTVGDVVDRVFRDWLLPSDDQPVTVTLSGAVTTVGQTSFSYDDDALAPDEEDLLAPGVLAEVGSEQVRITAVDETANTLTVTRGVNGTTATTHAAGAEITVAPVWPRRVVFDAVCDNVVALYPDLWRTTDVQVTSATAYVEVPAAVINIDDAFYLTSGSQIRQASVALHEKFPPSSTGKAITFQGTPVGKTVYVTYRAEFERPTAEADDLTVDFGVEPGWERIIAAGAAAQVLAGRDLDPVTAEFITEQLEREAYPAGSAARSRDALLRYYNFLLSQANRNLRTNDVVPVVMQY